MDPKEIDLALDELETRLDRLRSLYEQYFLGIEKIEPQVARKDVDRRFWLLRKVNIRNTARRFRMQVLLQRYNTFQQHWARICREIENGTYTRHLLKVKKNLGVEPKTWAAKRRLGLLRRGPDGKLLTEAGADGEASEVSGVNDAREANAPQASPGGFDAGDPFHAIERNIRYDAEEDDEDGALETRRPPPPTGGARGARVEIPAFPKQPPLRSLEDLDLLDLDLDDGPPPPKAPAARAPTPAATPQRVSTRPPVPRPASVRPQAPAPARSPAVSRPPAPPGPPLAAQPARQPPVPATTTAAGGGLERVTRAAPTRAPAPAGPSPFAANGPHGPFATGPAPTSPKPAGTEGPGLPRPGMPRPGAPNGQAGAAATRPPAAVQQPVAPKPAAGLSDERVRQLHAELVATKQKLNQPNNISLDSLAKSLRETESKLKAQHQGRSIDFNVVLKDGKPVVKPLVRK